MKNLTKKALVVVACGMLFAACELFEDTVNPGLTESEIIQGLKEALTIGLDNSVTSASSVDGYLKNEAIKILLPEDVQNLKEKIDNSNSVSLLYDTYVASFNGGTDLFDELITTMNRGAEAAASEAGGIFLNAITSMTFDDARAILNGNETAATDYFYNATNQQLFNAFQPEIKTALDGSGANDVYELAYDFLSYDPTGLGLTPTPGEALDVTIEPTLDEYATNRAIDGLFTLIAGEEKKIRDDPFAWGSAIIEKVFGSQ
ncbi:MAG: DUF4197 domain-containing protein [Ekhidna sp.]